MCECIFFGIEIISGFTNKSIVVVGVIEGEEMYIGEDERLFDFWLYFAVVDCMLYNV